MGDRHNIGDLDFFQPEDVLYRRLLACHVLAGEVVKGHCPTEQWKEGLSCDWAVITPPEKSPRETEFVLEFSVRHCRELGIEVRYCPVVEPNHPDYNLAHCLLFLPAEILQDKRKLEERRYEFLKRCVHRPWPV
ncbi:MAG: hypothetical protein ABIP48_27850 [Planctomycetota bacterium]